MIKWTVKKSEENLALIEYLQGRIEGAPLSYLRQIIRKNRVSCNAAACSEETLLQPGDIITLPESKRIKEFLSGAGSRMVRLFESDNILIVHKPAGLATHSSRNHEHDNLVDRVARDMKADGKTFMVSAIHRLDLPTSGPVLFGKGRKSISALGKMMQESKIRKKYLALITRGLQEKGLISTHIVSKGKIKHAETRYRIIEEVDNLALVELELETGRQHQLRKQLSDEGYPIAGDNRYRGVNVPGLDRLFLHCHYLELTDPFNDQRINLNDPLPAPLTQVLTRQGFSFNAG